MRLEGKVAVVTGAGYGIGRGIALRLAREGAAVVVAYGHSEQDARETKAEIESINGTALMVQADVTNKPQVDGMMNAALQHFDRLDILVNNAGVADQSPLLELEEETWDWLMGVNLKGPYLCSRAAARVMVKQGQGGRIIHIGSVNSTRSVPGRAHYAASKAGLVAMNKVIACELAPHRITCNVVAPGVTYSRMTERMLSDPEALAKKTLASIPLGRVGTPEDVAAVVAFLSSQEADYITGVNIDVDGGLVPAPRWDNV
jgi:NAD(P)-dependent dehydrogenase (short-subunit alcohol dehydrogenase family)